MTMLTNVDKKRCEYCNSTNIKDTFDSFECHDCSYVCAKFVTPFETLSNKEIDVVFREIVKKHGIKNPQEIELLKQSLIREKTILNHEIDNVFDHEPVAMDELFDSDRYFGIITDSLWPKLRKEIFLIFENPNITTIVLKGSIGWGKTYIIGYSLLTILYKICCLKKPMEFFGLDANTPMSFFNFCRTKELAKKTLFAYLITWFDQVAWFKKYSPRNIDKIQEIEIKSKLITCFFGGPNPKAVMGTNVHSFVGDELDFMDKIEDSKRTRDQEVYDEAKHTVDMVTQRQTSRFKKEYRYCPPRRFLSSSAQFPDDYIPTFVQGATIDGKIVSHQELINGDFDPKKQNTYIIQKANWETPPISNFPGWTFERDKEENLLYFDEDGKCVKKEKGNPKFITFSVGLGHVKKGDKLLKDGESERGYREILKIPIVYKSDFEGSNSALYKAIRDTAGRETLYNNPWFLPDQLYKCVNEERIHPCNYINPSLEEKDFHLEIQKMFNLSEEGNVFKNSNTLRYAHLDLSKTTDHSAITIVHVDKLIPIMIRICGELTIEWLPFFHVDLMLRIKPPGDGRKINYQLIRNILYLLKKKGMQFGMITYDQVEGEMQTHFDKNEIPCDNLSLDTQMEPWHHLDDVFIEKRIDLYHYQPLFEELPYLYHDTKKNKIDHRAKRRKDVSDSLTGAIWNANRFDERIDPSTVADINSMDDRISINSRDLTVFEEAEMPNFYGKDYGFKTKEN
jgi:hypothetical protein